MARVEDESGIREVVLSYPDTKYICQKTLINAKTTGNICLRWRKTTMGLSKTQEMSQPTTPQEAKIDLIKKLLKLTGVSGTYIQSVRRSVASTLANNPGAMDLFDKLIERRSVELIDISTPAWDEALTVDDLRGIVQFLESDLGKKFLEAIPSIDKVLNKPMTSWAQSLLEELADDLQKNYWKMKAEQGINWRDYVPPLEINLYGPEIHVKRQAR
jgi:hypothetical protein